MAAPIWGDDYLFPNDNDPSQTTVKSLKFLLCAILFSVSQIPFAMSLSTLFSDSKVANSIGGLIVIFPIALFL
jgi:hypothetical protein